MSWVPSPSVGHELPEEARDDLGRLGDALAWSGLAEYVACFDPFRPRGSDWERCRSEAPERLQPLIDLFLLGREVLRDALPRPLRTELVALEATGLLRSRAGAVAMRGGVVILPVFGRWLICHPPQANPRFYFGDDTVALLARSMPKAGGSCLDLCSGPGMLAMHAAGSADQVVAVERSPEAAQTARLNVALNRLSRRIEVIEGDLYGPVAGRSFDTVIANPPMLPIPAGLAGPTIGSGGEDGLAVTRRILSGLPAVLAPDGTAQIIGMVLSDGVRPLGLDEALRGAASGLDLIVSILSNSSLEEGGPFLEAMVAAVAHSCGEDHGKVRAAYRGLLKEAGASALCHLFLHARHGSGRADLIDMAGRRSRSVSAWRGCVEMSEAPNG